MKKWNKLPPELRIDEVRPYYDILKKHKCGRFFKRLFDITVSFVMLICFSPLFFILAIAIKIDSRGPVFYRQERVTRYGKKFRIYKFRTMMNNADKIGSQVTVHGDARITKVGKFIRKCRLDEVSQLLNVFGGSMTFVGTRPEVPKFVERYTPEMMATLLMPAGVTSMASIYYKNEAELLDNADNVDEVYINKVLPGKMFYNLKSIKRFGFWRDIGTMFKTVFAVLGKKYVDKDVPKIDIVDEYEEAASSEEYVGADLVANENEPDVIDMPEENDDTETKDVDESI